jgi:hypothetical protein
MDDPVRQLIRDKAAERGLSLRWLSQQIRRNEGYLFDFLEKGSPQGTRTRPHGGGACDDAPLPAAAMQLCLTKMTSLAC